MPPPKPEDLCALADLTTSTLGLISQFTSSLSTNTEDAAKPTPITSPPNPLHVLRDSATLLKAHTTKISLLVINKPFTPSAITKVLRELAGTCLPAMMSAVQIVEQKKSTSGAMMGKEVQSRVRRIFKEMEVMLNEVADINQAYCEGRIPDQDGKKKATSGRDSLSTTGVVWESCDAVIELEKLGLGGLAVQKAEQYRDTIKDAIEELREWGEGGDTDNEGPSDDALLDSDDEAVDGDRDSLDDIFNAANSLPRDRKDLRILLDDALKKLPKIRVLYDAVIKRRLKTFQGGGVNNVETLDNLTVLLRRIPHIIDEIAGFFYDLDADSVKNQIGYCCEVAVQADELVLKDWGGREDAFTDWSGKWRQAIG